MTTTQFRLGYINPWIAKRRVLRFDLTVTGDGKSMPPTFPPGFPPPWGTMASHPLQRENIHEQALGTPAAG